MTGLLGRRARAQWPLLTALVAVVTAGASLLGVSALLVTVGAEQARESAAAAATPAKTAATGYVGAVARGDVPSVAADVRDVLVSALAPFAVTTEGRASSVMRPLPADAGETPAVGYLSGVENLAWRAQLVSGRWPRPGGGEAAVLEPTARLLGLAPGSRVPLGTEFAVDPAPGLEVAVVGVVRPLPGAGWERDLLAGAGFDPAYRDSSSVRPARAFGPFLVDYGALLSGGSTVSRLEIVAHPDLSDPDHRDLDQVATRIHAADRRLEAVLGERVQLERLASQLPSTLGSARDQQRVTTAAVLAVAALGVALTLAALALAGRLMTEVRAAEAALLSAMGASRSQRVLLATAEKGLLALIATLLAVPLSSAVHWSVTGLAAVTGVQVLAVAAGTLLLLLPSPGSLGARSGIDLLAVALAVGGWWQLRAQPETGQVRIDAVLVLAPALLLAAGCALASRLVTPALAVGERMARRARGLPLPLAVLEAARRPRATAAGLLIALGCAAATFGVAFDATWHRSQREQADLAVGTDLAITLDGPVTAGQGTAVAAAAGGPAGPAVNRGVAVGQWLGSGGEPSRLVAVDMLRAGTLLRGGGTDWTTVGAGLAPVTPAGGIAMTDGGTVTVSGRTSGPDRMTVTPRLILEDGSGLRTVCSGLAVPLDGRPHELPGCAAGRSRLVAVMLPVTADVIGWESTGSSDIDVTLRVPDGQPSGGAWSATSSEPDAEQLTAPTVTAVGTSLRMTATVQLGGPDQAARQLVATSFPDPGPVPVAVSRRLADQLLVRPGTELEMTVGDTAVPAKITTIVPEVPAAPGAAALLADLDTLSRAMLARGNSQFPADAWWVAHPADAAAVAGLHLGEIRTRTAETARLTTGAVPAGLPAVLRLLVPAAMLLLFAGVVLHVTCDLQVRAVEIVRLRGLGMTRREVRTTLLGQYGLVMLPLLAAGAAIGALATWAVGPLMIRTEYGAAPVPPVTPVWPWAAESALLAVLLTGCLIAVTAVVLIRSRRADATQLRVS